MKIVRESQGKKGRPVGFKLSEASKRSISESKKGQRHKETTKSKISRSLQNYFRLKDPLSEELISFYFRHNEDDACEWLVQVEEELDDFRDILTYKTLQNKMRIEISYGDNIEEIFSHSVTPELLLMYKQQLEGKK